MKKVYLFFLFISLLHCSVIAQTVSVNGLCITGPATLNPVADVAGKPAYDGSGTVLGIPNTQISIYWIPAPDNVWVLAFDGQPYLMNSCGSSLPPGTGNPSCLWAPVQDMECTGATALSITGDVVLPVSLTTFTAIKNNRNVVLKWRTSGEMNNKGFEIQKSNDGVNWISIGFVNGHVLSTAEISYQFTDPAPYKGKNAYRLRQVNLDGNQSYSAVVIVNFQVKTFYTISDNPGKGIYKITMPADMEKLDLNITDAVGKVMYKKTTVAGNQLLNISRFAPGTYWLQIRE